MKNNKRLTVILLCVLLALLGFLIYSVVTIEMEDERAIEEYDTYDSILYFNEVNTIPGFTQISMYPKLFNQEGISIKNLITKLLS